MCTASPFLIKKEEEEREEGGGEGGEGEEKEWKIEPECDQASRSNYQFTGNIEDQKTLYYTQGCNWERGGQGKGRRKNPQINRKYTNSLITIHKAFFQLF